jgi:hypothetical protein
MNQAIRKNSGAVMEEYDKEYYIGVGVRAALRAFRYITRPGESPVAYFGGAHRPKTPRRSKTRPRTQVMHAVATRPSGTSKPNMLDRQELTGHIHRAIAELEPLEFLWIQYRYRPEGLARAQHGENFHRAYFARYESEFLQECKTGTRRMVRYLVAVAMDNEANPWRRTVRPDGSDINIRNWNKTYRPHWHRVCADISGLDATALYELGVKMEKIGPVA